MANVSDQDILRHTEKLISNIKCNYYLQSIYPKANRIIAIGDIHGDFSALLVSLLLAGVIDTNAIWIGGDTIVVQTGDIIDDCRTINSSDTLEDNKCYNSFEDAGEIHILVYLTELHSQAMKVGGKVLLCMGNHEWMAVSGDKNSNMYAQKQTHDKYGNDRLSMFAPGSKLAKKLACIMNVCVIVGDWAFLHGGLNLYNTSGVDSLIEANSNMRKYLCGKMSFDEKINFINQINRDNNWFFYDRSSSRNTTEDENSDACNNYSRLISNRVMDLPNLKMVVGHTVHKYPNSICNIDNKPRIYRIDMGMSKAFGKKNSEYNRIHLLEIIYNSKNNMEYINVISESGKTSVPHGEHYKKLIDNKIW